MKFTAYYAYEVKITKYPKPLTGQGYLKENSDILLFDTMTDAEKALKKFEKDVFIPAVNKTCGCAPSPTTTNTQPSSLDLL